MMMMMMGAACFIVVLLSISIGIYIYKRRTQSSEITREMMDQIQDIITNSINNTSDSPRTKRVKVRAAIKNVVPQDYRVLILGPDDSANKKFRNMSHRPMSVLILTNEDGEPDNVYEYDENEEWLQLYIPDPRPRSEWLQ
jgi:hypothetical protein